MPNDIIQLWLNNATQKIIMLLDRYLYDNLDIIIKIIIMISNFKQVFEE